MNIESINGIDDINGAVTSAMAATVNALVSEGLLDSERGEAFKNTHVVALVNSGGMWRAIRKLLGMEGADNRLAVLRILSST